MCLLCTLILSVGCTKRILTVSLWNWRIWVGVHRSTWTEKNDKEKALFVSCVFVASWQKTCILYVVRSCESSLFVHRLEWTCFFQSSIWYFWSFRFTVDYVSHSHAYKYFHLSLTDSYSNCRVQGTCCYPYRQMSPTSIGSPTDWIRVVSNSPVRWLTIRPPDLMCWRVLSRTHFTSSTFNQSTRTWLTPSATSSTCTQLKTVRLLLVSTSILDNSFVIKCQWL